MPCKKIQQLCYIPVTENNYLLFTRFEKPYWIPARQVPVSEIKIDKSLMSFPNDVSEQQITTIIENFDSDFWLPITLNSDYFLLDGQHRIEAAKRMKLKYIDAVIQDVELLNAKG